MQNLSAITKNIFNILADNPNKLSFLILFCFALILRIHHLDFESLWMDEIRQTSYYANPLLEIIDNAASQSQPPLDYWIGHFIHFLSNGDFAVRLPAALFGAGSVFLLTILIYNISSWPVACGFGVLSALLPFNLYYSQEARPYAIAVFLFLCLFWTLNRFLSTERKQKLITAAALLCLSIAFMHSRALSPLVITICLLLILPPLPFINLIPAGGSTTEKKRLVLISCGVFILALLAYLPSLKIILLKSKRFVSDDSIGLKLDSIISAVLKFDLVPVWQAYVVQSEPITYPLLFLVALSPFFGWYLGLHRKNTIWILTTLLLPVASIFNLIIFQSKSDMPFRPSYVSYLLPLACILGAISIQGFWSLSAKARFGHIARCLILILSALFTFQSLMSAVDYKSMIRKPDWRGVTAFLAENYDTKHLLIFDSLSHYDAWEPTYYGFPRYYRGRSPFASMKRIPFQAPKMTTFSLTPVLILFQWREYYLTSQSPYPILSVPSPELVSIDYQQTCRDPGLACTEFPGFSLIQLRKKSNNLAQDTYGIIEKLLLRLPEGSWKVELHLSAAALARMVKPDQWEYHLRQAEFLAPSNQLQQVKDTVKFIRLINPP